MKLFVYEHFSSGALIENDLSLEMLKEGESMLNALSHDLLKCGHEVYQLRDHRLAPSSLVNPALKIETISHKKGFHQAWQNLPECVDATCIIAPETSGALTQKVTDLEQRGLRHLNADSEVISLCSDKFRCAQFLNKHHMYSPHTYTPSSWKQRTETTQHWVVKPRDGAGCENTFLFDLQTCKVYLDSQPQQVTDNIIIQPYVYGTPLSLSLFIYKNKAELLSINQQHITNENGRLGLSHIDTGKTELLSKHIAQQLADHLTQILPGLQGFIGIDMIKHEEGLSVIEINPRLTSAYPAFNQRQKDLFIQHFEHMLKRT
jgi:predicted ATP-grasp superfamily ATP-dependent carboligase